ncbi:MAG: VWA domain-containing protein [Myxococcales bacterium]|nr:VWA domain-containing protein [Myxococcales bacterium]
MGALGPGGVTEPPPGTVDELVDEVDPQADGGTGDYGILLFDTSSSMNTVRPSTGNTRCYDARIMARGIIYDFFDPDIIDGVGLAIWAFSNNSSTSDDVQPTMVGYYTDEPTAIAAVNALTCNGSTPLADAMCKGLQGDGETFTVDPAHNRMYILTDGLEDNSNGECSGSSGSVTTPGTWEYKVMAMMTSTGIRIDTRYWIDPELLYSKQAIDSLAYDDAPHDPIDEVLIVADVEGLPPHKVDQLMLDADPSAVEETTGVAEAEPQPQPLPKPVCDLTCQELSFFEALALESGGSWGVVSDSDGNYPVESTIDPVSGPVQPEIAPAQAQPAQL